jgi:16S rRNA (cytosine1402-N4)-methyltransferase
MAADTTHIPVLLREAIDALALRPDATVIDATLGSSGHFSAILEKFGANATLLGIDADKKAVEAARRKLQMQSPQKEAHPHILLAVGNFRNIEKVAKENGIEHADAIVADLGWRIEQFSSDASVGGGKGFSFASDEPLYMTFGNPADYPFIAATIVNEWKEEDIANVLKAYGEERYARRIARAVALGRREKTIETSAELAQIIADAVPAAYRHGRIHPATKTFQALRIAVNDELDALQEFIESAAKLLSPKGRLAIISFHSIEDRVVKQTMRRLEEEGTARRIVKKPITPTDEEIRENPRARSAKLRIIEKT